MEEKSHLIAMERTLKRQLGKLAREVPTTPSTSKNNALISGQSVLPSAGSREATQLSLKKAHVDNLRNYFNKIVIRRRHDSVDNLGHPISGLPGIMKFTIYVEMSKSEADQFEKIKEETLKQM